MTENNNPPQKESVIKFPCDFVVKVMGSANAIFEQKVFHIVQRHFPEFSKENISKRHSKDHNYLSLTIKLHVANKAQLDSLYEELQNTPEILMVL